MNMNKLESTALELVAKGKGILAADESFSTIAKRFDSIRLSNSEDNRRAYRDLLFSAPGLSDFISGVILFDETIKQRGNDGRPFPEMLKQQRIVPGIKVDAGTESLA